MSEDGDIEDIHAEETVKWASLQDSSSLRFLGKDVFALCDRLHIYFYDIINRSELIYNATNPNNGDGVECFAGHRTLQLFVFAEICKSPRIFLLTYPDFKIMRILRDNSVTAYAAVGLTELEQIVSLSAYPNYIMTVWCWRTNRKLISCDTGVRSPNFFFRCSLSLSLILHGWDKRYCVWEVAPCYKTCMLLKRQLRGNIPKIADVTWTPEGNIYCIDKEANIYSILNDGIGMIVVKEWTATGSGQYHPSTAYFKNGLVVYGPELELKHFVKVNKEWAMDWCYSPDTPVLKMTGGGLGETLLIVCKNGKVLQVAHDHDKVTTNLLFFWQRHIKWIGVLNPFGNTIVTVNKENVLCLWNSITGQLFSRTQLNNAVNCMSCSPTGPLIAMCISSHHDYGVCIMHGEPQLRITCSKNLTDQILNHVIWSASGNELVASALSTGQIFFLKYKSPPNIDVVNMINIKNSLVDCWTTTIGKDLYFMGLGLIVNVYTNIPEKVLLCYNFLSCKEISVYGRIEPTLLKVVHLENNVMIGINTLPKEFQVFSVTLEEAFLKLSTDNLIPLDFEISGISFQKDKGGVLTWGMDGHIVYKMSIFEPDLKYKIKAKHIFDEGLRYALMDPQQRYALSLTYNGTLTVHNVSSNVNAKPVDLSGKLIIPEQTTMVDIFEDSDDTWIHHIELIKENQETSKWAELRNSLQRGFDTLQRKLLVLLEDNISAPPLHQLPLNIFNLHIDAQTQREKKAAKDRERVREAMEEQIKNQDTVTGWIKAKCWDTMDVVGKELHAIFTSEFVENYALNPQTHADKAAGTIVENLRRIESMKDDNVFKPWIPPVSSEIMLVESELSAEKSDVVEQPADNMSDVLKTEVSETATIEEFIHQITGSSAHLFITPLPHSYVQMLTQSNLQMRWQTTMTEQITHMTKVWFNKQFNEMMSNKQKELGMIEDKNKRLNVIISELNILSSLKGSDDVIDIYINDPQWAQEEIPSKLITVEEDEVDITPYVSPSQVVIPPPDLGPKDDFREKALMYMMDGVLEKLWHEEIKKLIPKPQCMLIKEAEDYEEEDLKLIMEWEKMVEFRNEEREKYRKMLRTEYGKLSAALNEMISRFNQKVKDFYLLKLKVESAIGQENLKLMRLRVSHLDRIETVEKMHDLEIQMSKNEMDLDKNQKDIQDIQTQQSDCIAAYEGLMARDRNLDKNFKSSFSDVSPIVADLCYKLFKKRPKWQQRASMTAGVLYEMAFACLTKEKPEFLHVDCHEFLKALDQLDLLSNMPPVLDETVWTTMCKLRRIKVDNEIKIKASGAELADVEATYTLWQKRSSNLKLAGQKMRHELTQHRSNIENAAKNISIQLVIKSGFVETETSGHADDFDSAVLIKQDEVDAVNVKILEAGQSKIKAMRATTSFKKHILSMEWEHARLKMKIRHLQQDLYDLERIKVTKEVRYYLQEKTKKQLLRKNIANIESQMENTKVSFNNQVYGYIQRVEELEMKVGSIRTNIHNTDEYIERLKIKVSEKHHAEDPAAMKKKLKVQATRMEAMVSRSKLLSDVQKQYIAIVLLQTELELQRLRTFPTLTVAKK